MSLFNTLRTAIAQAIMPNRQPIQMVQAEPEEVVKPQRPKFVAAPRQQAITLYGNLDMTQIQDLQSSRVRDAIANFAAWQALANGFSAYCNTINRKRPNEKEVLRMHQMMDYFHAWNSIMSTPMDDVSVENQVMKMAVIKPAAENEQTDIILARVKKVPVEQVRAEREARMTKLEAQRMENVTGYLAELWGCTTTDEIPTVNATMAYTKAIACLEWLSNWTTPDIGEILIAEGDINTLKAYSDRATRMEGAGESSREIDEQLLDAHGMAQGSHK